MNAKGGPESCKYSQSALILTTMPPIQTMPRKCCLQCCLQRPFDKFFNKK